MLSKPYYGQLLVCNLVLITSSDACFAHNGILFYYSQVLKGHDDHVITCLQFSAQRIVSGSDDNTLKVWSALTGKVRESFCKSVI